MTINAEDFLLNKVREINYKQPTPKQVEQWMIEFAKIHVTEALKQASEKARTPFDSDGDAILDKNSILTAYSLDNIE